MHSDFSFKSKIFTNFLDNRIKTKESLSNHVTQIDMSNIDLSQFWEVYRQFLESQPLKGSDFVTFKDAGISSGIERRALKTLGDKGIVRVKNDKVALPDAKLLGKILNDLKEANTRELLKETKITGAKKYLMLDFHSRNSGKTMTEYQLELMFKLYTDFFGQMFDMVPKSDFTTPPNIAIYAKKLLDKSNMSEETLSLVQESKTKLKSIHEKVKAKLAKE